MGRCQRWPSYKLNVPATALQFSSHHFERCLFPSNMAPQPRHSPVEPVLPSRHFQLHHAPHPPLRVNLTALAFAARSTGLRDVGTALSEQCVRLFRREFHFTKVGRKMGAKPGPFEHKPKDSW